MKLGREFLEELRAADHETCWLCDDRSGWARVYFRAGDTALWLPACREHRTALTLVA